MLFGVAAAAEEPSPTARYGTFRLGPVYLSLNAPFALGVESNVYNTPQGLSDRSASITPGLQAVLPLTRHARLRGTGGVVPQYFHREKTQRYTDVFGEIRGEVDAGPLTAFGALGGARYRQRFSLEVDERLHRKASTEIFGGTLRFKRRVSLTGSRSTVTSTFDQAAELAGQSVSGSLDRKSIARRLELRLPLTRRTTLAPWAEQIEDRFLRPSPTRKPLVNSQRYGIALQFNELAFMTGMVAAGLRHFGSNEGVKPYDGLFISANVSMPFVLKSRLLLAIGRDVDYAVTPAAGAEELRNTYVNSTYRAEMAFELPWRLAARAGGGYSEAQYLLPVAGSSPLGSRRDHVWLEQGALLRHLGSHLSLGIQVAHENRVSPADGRTYQSSRIGLGGEMHF